jgi:ABC-type lipoprotein export system ATPase subunit
MSSESSQAVIQAQGLKKSFDHGRIRVLDGVDLEIQKGEIVALWGASGSGKSTLLHLLGGLDSPDEGTVLVHGRGTVSEADRLDLRRHRIGFVFQLHNLIPDLTLEENCRVPCLAAGRGAAYFGRRLVQLAGEVGLGHRLKHRIQDLSGGERQRTALIRALINEPGIILADEPTGALDEASGKKIFELLHSLARDRGITVVLATHERRFAEACNRLIRVKDGRLLPA